jgi:hypothetical protein
MYSISNLIILFSDILSGIFLILKQSKGMELYERRVKQTAIFLLPLAPGRYWTPAITHFSHALQPRVKALDMGSTHAVKPMRLTNSAINV